MLTTNMVVALSLTPTDQSDPRWLTDPPVAETVHIRADDLATAQLARARLRAAHNDRGHRTDAPSVVLDVAVHVAHDARTARTELADARVHAPRTVCYIGTPSGLAGLIADIGAAHVADGVTIFPLLDTHRVELERCLLDEVLPMLHTRAAHSESTYRRTA